jgi:hypothetical protein
MKFCIHTIFEPSAKKHLPFFSCFVKKIFSILQEFAYLSDEEYPSFVKYSPKINTVSPSCSRCNMLYDAYVMQNDVMMLCYAK